MSTTNLACKNTGLIFQPVFYCRLQEFFLGATKNKGLDVVFRENTQAQA
jgi:hypothetical protein